MFSLFIRGYYVIYGEMRMMVMGEQLLRGRKPLLNVVDRYAMAVKKDSCITVGHCPQKIAVLYEEVRWLIATATEHQQY